MDGALPLYTLRPLPPLLPSVSDLHLSLAVPILVHWVLSGIFCLLETYGLFQQYRLHVSAEEEARNRCSRWQCFRGVVLNQVIQTLLGVGLGMLGEGDVTGKEEYDIAVWAKRIHTARRLLPRLLSIAGVDTNGLAVKFAGSGMSLTALLTAGDLSTMPQGSLDLDNWTSHEAKLREWETMLAHIVYWYIIPVVQFASALFAADTWQYFGHRWLHTRWAYKNIHSVHHTLYVPYSFGAAFTHPLEGLFLDSVGTAIAFGVSGLSIRQGMWLYGYISFKAVTDHCGYVFPWNPIRMITDNDSRFHDLHHRNWGLKMHFAVHFTFWDRMLGTYWIDKSAADALYKRDRDAVERQIGLKQGEEGQRASSTT